MNFNFFQRITKITTILTSIGNILNCSAKKDAKENNKNSPTQSNSPLTPSSQSPENTADISELSGASSEQNNLSGITRDNARIDAQGSEDVPSTPLVKAVSRYNKVDLSKGSPFTEFTTKISLQRLDTDFHQQILKGRDTTKYIGKEMLNPSETQKSQNTPVTKGVFNRRSSFTEVLTEQEKSLMMARQIVLGATTKGGEMTF